jgi:hypothetical protein
MYSEIVTQKTKKSQLTDIQLTPSPIKFWAAEPSPSAGLPIPLPSGKSAFLPPRRGVPDKHLFSGCHPTSP